MIQLLLRQWQATAHDAAPDLQALFMATLTLKRMADGGLCDQLGGGFCRYSVDERWEIPHFEKMLYDNGALLSAYAEAAVATGDSDFAQVASGTARVPAAGHARTRRGISLLLGRRFAKAMKVCTTCGLPRRSTPPSARTPHSVRRLPDSSRHATASTGPRISKASGT